MTTEQTLTPAQELRAAASKIREVRENKMMADWLAACADDMEAKPEVGPEGWGHALDIARAINGEVTR